MVKYSPQDGVPAAASDDRPPPSATTLPGLAKEDDTQSPGGADATTPITLKSVYPIQETVSVSIAAIDNGLAFPHKHPDQWRSYPYGWASLPLSSVAFSAELRASLVPLLSDTAFWENLEIALQDVFKMDKDYDETLWRRQWALIRGQGFNILKTLRKEGSTPLQLVSMERVMIFEVCPSFDTFIPKRKIIHSIVCDDDNNINRIANGIGIDRRWKQTWRLCAWKDHSCSRARATPIWSKPLTRARRRR